MSTSRILAAAATLATVVLFGAAQPGAQFVDTYTATLIHSEGSIENPSKVYVSGDKYRVEPDASYQPMIIGRKGDDVMYTLDRDAKRYTEDVFRNEAFPHIFFLDRPTKRVNQGNETVDGVGCVKEEITAEDEYGNEYKEFRWYDRYSQRLVQVQSEDGEDTFKLKDVDPGRLDDSLFEPPADYQKY